MDRRTSRTWLFRGMALRVGLLVLASSLIASVAISWISVRSLESFLRTRIDRKFPELLEGTSGRLELWYRQRGLDFDVFARSPILTQSVGRSGKPRVEAERYLSYLLESFPQYEALVILDAQADPWIAVGTDIALSESQWREAVGPQPGITRFLDAQDQRVQLVSAPVEGQGTRATLVGVLHPESLTASLAPVAEGGVEIAVLSSTGEILVGRTDVRPPPESGVHIVAADTGRYVAASLPFERFGWRLVVAQDYDVAFAPVSETVDRALFSNLLVILVSSGLAFAIGAWRMRPILRLADGAQRLAAGDVDVRVSEKGSLGEVQVLAHSFNEMAGKLAENRRELEMRNHALLRANEVLEQLSITDGLTKLHNHRHFQDQFGREAKRSERGGSPLVLVLIDIDDFKKLNDRLGHSAGDRVLETVAALMNALSRETDYVARYGGEEFAMLLPQTEMEGALALTEKIRLEIASLEVEIPGAATPARVTASFGLASYAESPARTFDAADAALYEAKASGKDCVTIGEVSDVSPTFGG
jgi:diguanylate cyclase (GGDEF)-like protein